MKTDKIEPQRSDTQNIKVTDSEQLLTDQIFDLMDEIALHYLKHPDGYVYPETPPGWNIKIIPFANINRSTLRRYWKLAVIQTNCPQFVKFGRDIPQVPVMFYNRGCKAWRAVWPRNLDVAQQHDYINERYEDTIEGSTDEWLKIVQFNFAQRRDTHIIPDISDKNSKHHVIH